MLLFYFALFFFDELKNLINICRMQNSSLTFFYLYIFISLLNVPSLLQEANLKRMPWFSALLFDNFYKLGGSLLLFLPCFLGVQGTLIEPWTFSTQNQPARFGGQFLSNRVTHKKSLVLWCILVLFLLWSSRVYL